MPERDCSQSVVRVLEITVTNGEGEEEAEGGRLRSEYQGGCNLTVTEILDEGEQGHRRIMSKDWKWMGPLVPC